MKKLITLAVVAVLLLPLAAYLSDTTITIESLDAQFDNYEGTFDKQ